MANDVSSPMPQMDLRDNTILTVSLDDAGARITRLVVHGWQAVDNPPKSRDTAPVMFLPGSEA